MDTPTEESEETRLEQLEQEIEEQTRTVDTMKPFFFLDPKRLAKQQELLGSKLEERALILERRRVAAIVRRFEEEHPRETEDCPICLEPMPIHMDEALSRLACCGKSVCLDCDKSRALREKCPHCRARIPTSGEEYLQKLLPLASRGCAWAEFHVGYRYGTAAENATSINMRRIHEENAVKWYQKAAEHGNCSAQTILGEKYLFDNMSMVVSPSYEEARRWFEAAAVHGQVTAQSLLGFMCLKGKGAPQNYEQGIYWCTLAGASNNTEAKYHDPALLHLGLAFIDGEGGLDECFYRAKFYLEKAAVAGAGKAPYFLAFVLLNLGVRHYGSNFIPGHSCVPRCLYWWRNAVPGNHTREREVAGMLEQLEGRAKSHCANCHMTREACGGLNCCTRCRAVWYCGKECQRKHWKDGHKIDCFSG